MTEFASDSATSLTTILNLRSEDLDLGEGNIRLYSAGEAGPPVVLLHGGGLDAAMISWRHAIPALAEKYRVYAFDWPKQGHSSGWTRTMTTDALIDVLVQVLDRLGLDRAAFVGLSMGSCAAIGLALDHPERVDALVLGNPGGIQKKVPYHTLAWLMFKIPGMEKAGMGGTKEKLKKRLENGLFSRNVADINQVVDDVWEEMQRRTSAFSDFQIAELAFSGVKVNFMPRLHEIAAPTLIIHGQDDQLVPVKLAREAAERLPNGRLHEIENAGHWPNREAPTEFNEVMMAFLDGTLTSFSASS